MDKNTINIGVGHGTKMNVIDPRMCAPCCYNCSYYFGKLLPNKTPGKCDNRKSLYYEEVVPVVGTCQWWEMHEKKCGTIGKWEVWQTNVSPKYDTHYFHLKASNGKIILQSEGYSRTAGVSKGINSIQRNALLSPIIEQGKKE